MHVPGSFEAWIYDAVIRHRRATANEVDGFLSDLQRHMASITMPADAVRTNRSLLRELNAHHAFEQVDWPELPFS